MTQNCTPTGSPVYYDNNAEALLPLINRATGSFNPPNGIFYSYPSQICVSSFVNSSTDIGIAGGFSYGDIVISTQLFLLLACALTLTYFFHFRRVRIKN
jgi:hypothetical protein